MPVQRNERALHPENYILRGKHERTIQDCGHLHITTEIFIIQRKLLEDLKIVRVQFRCVLKIPRRFLPTPLPSIDIGGEQKSESVVGQRLLCGSQFLTSTIVIEVSPVEMFRQGKMGLARVRMQTAQRLNRRIGQRQACRRVVEIELVDRVVSLRQFVIGKKKRWITLDCLVQQPYGFEQIYFGPP